MVIDYDSVNVSFQKHGNRLQHVIIDYESETVKPVSHGNQLHYVIIVKSLALMRAGSGRRCMRHDQGAAPGRLLSGGRHE